MNDKWSIPANIPGLTQLDFYADDEAFQVVAHVLATPPIATARLPRSMSTADVLPILTQWVKSLDLLGGERHADGLADLIAGSLREHSVISK